MRRKLWIEDPVTVSSAPKATTISVDEKTLQNSNVDAVASQLSESSTSKQSISVQETVSPQEPVPKSVSQVIAVNDAVDPGRPIMHTYYEPTKTDMTRDGDMDLLENWKKAWYDAGWEPRIVTQAAAEAVPEYENLIDLIVDPDFVGGYNMACYIRWIAMAGVGGGFMSDYDVFPLHHFLRDGRKLPYDGQLTVYSRFVPALVSGSASEYLRIARRIGESIHKHVHMQKYINENSSRNHYQKRVPWSDMKALQELKNASKGMFVMRFDVVSAEQFLKLDNFTEQHCEWTDGMRAVHFSHRSIKEGKQAHRGAVHRGTIARLFMNKWHKLCKAVPLSNY